MRYLALWLTLITVGLLAICLAPYSHGADVPQLRPVKTKIGRLHHYDHYFRLYARRYFGREVDWRWFRAMGMAESNLTPDVVSSCGAQGVMQLMPATSAELAEQLATPNRPFDPRVNIKLGVAYARQLWLMWPDFDPRDRIRMMLASYNAGPTNISRAQQIVNWPGCYPCVQMVLPLVTGNHAAQTRAYIARVEHYYATLGK